MHFSIGEIFISIICSLIYGALFFVFYTATVIIKVQLEDAKAIIKIAFVYDKIFKKPTINIGRSEKSCGNLLSFLLVSLFSVGFILLSYYALDGCVRIYVLLLSLFSFFALKWLLFEKTVSLFEHITYWILCVFVILLRMFTFPILRFLRYLKKKKAVLAEK